MCTVTKEAEAFALVTVTLWCERDLRWISTVACACEMYVRQ